MMAVQKCYRPLCLLGWAPCETEWLGSGRARELWAVCALCGKRRVFLNDMRGKSFYEGPMSLAELLDRSGADPQALKWEQK